MGTVIFRNEEQLSTSDIKDIFSKKLEETGNFKQSEIEELAEINAKNITDKFIISDDSLIDTFGRQGDILFWKEGSEMYEQEYKNIDPRTVKKTSRMILQKGDSVTGDHRLIPLKDSNFTLLEAKFSPSFLKNPYRTYDCLLLDIDKPFLVVHREHGNIALPAGKYMICSQMDSATLTRIID